MFKFYIYKISQFLVRRLPLNWAYRFAIFFSDMQYLISFRDRQAVKSNLKCILPSGEDLDYHTKEVFRNFGRYLVEFFRMTDELDEEFIKNRVHVHNIKAIEDVLAQGKGVVVITAHIGNWELGAVLLSMVGFPVMAVALPHKERPVNDLFNKQRESKGVTVIPSNVAIRRCMAALKENKIIALVADRVFGTHGFVMDFLGQKSLLPKGAALFSYKTGAGIVPTFLIREKDGSFSLILEDPIYPEKKFDDDDENLKAIIRKQTAVIEEKIRKFPSQWLMFRPVGVDPLLEEK